jgi:hypothetical protein
MQNETLTVKIAGGLGNQLFQLAAAKSTGSKTLLIDDSPLAGSERVFELNPLQESINFKVSGALQHPRLFTKKIREHKEFQWERLQINGKRPTVLSGYFQHPKYAVSIIQEVVRLIEVRLKLRRQSYCNCGQEHIAVHIRRGDYLSVPKNKRNFGVLSNEYFVSSLRKFSEKTHFIVFSDSDIESDLLQSVLPTTHLSFADSDLKPWDLLLEMSCMDGIVISNSSLSWWAARIGMEMRRNFRVVCPQIWFREIPASQNLILKQWELLEPVWIQ